MKKAVIIIARNEGNWTRKTSDDFKQNFPDCEIIGVSDGGINSWPDFVRVIKTDGGVGVGKCRRIGVMNTDADVVIITDGHVFFETGDIEKAWKFAEQGYIINSCTRSLSSGRNAGNGRTHILPNHEAKNVFAQEGDEVGMIGGVYFMRRDVALGIVAPTPSHGFNEQIMTCAAFSLGHKIYCYPDMVFKHLYKKAFNYKVTYSGQQRNRILLDWWFFSGKPPVNASAMELDYYKFIQANRILTPEQLTEKIEKMNEKLKSYGRTHKRL